MNLTEYIVIATIVILLTYDVIAVKIGEPTESMVLRDWAMDFTALPFTAGFLVGHWFFPRQTFFVSGWMYALPILISLLIFDIVWKAKKLPRHWSRYPGWYFILGVPAGMYLWGQIAQGSPIP